MNASFGLRSDHFHASMWIRLIGFVSMIFPSCDSFVVSREAQHPTSTLASLPTPLDTLTSGLASICRLPKGVQVNDGLGAPPAVRLVRLYDIENSPSCRIVRERITELDLTVDEIIPAAQNSRVFVDGTLAPGTVLPRLVVEATKKESVLGGTDDILAFLDQYTPVAEEEANMLLETLLTIGNAVASWLRSGRGKAVCSAASMTAGKPPPEQPLVLYSYEGNQFCRLVREVLTELDLTYELRNAGKGSPRRQELAARTGGSSQCPYLIDPNTDTELSESADIIRYLYTNYAQWIPPNELLQWASQTIVAAAKPIFAASTPLLAGSRNDDGDYERKLQQAEKDITDLVQSTPVVVYTYDWSPFSSETKALLDHLEIKYTDIRLGKEWIPGLINDPMIRAALLSMTGQSSLPHVFVGGESIGGLFSGTPGLVPALEEGSLLPKVEAAQQQQQLGSSATQTAG